MILQVLIAILACWIRKHQDQVIAYLQEENHLLKSKLKGRRLTLTDTERRRLAVLAHPIDRKRLQEVATLATGDTLQRWYRRLVAQQDEGAAHGKKPGRPRVAREIDQLVMRMAEENASWGYRRIQGALANVGYHIDKITVRNILRRHHMGPAPQRRKAGMSWAQFLQLHWEVLTATAFFTKGRETLAKVQTSVRQFRRDLRTLCIHLVGLLHHALLDVMILWQRLWSGLLWLTRAWPRHYDPLWAGVLVRLGVGRTEPSQVFVFVSSSLAARQCVRRRVQQESDPPTARCPRLTVTPSRPPWGSGAFGSRLLSTSHVDPHRRLVGKSEAA